MVENAGDTGSLLVVDDNAMNRDMLSRRLERRGYQVATAEGGREALELIASNSFDLLLLDVMMPEVSGLDVLKHVRESHAASELPVIMATARDQSTDIVEALQLGANDYVTKPLDFPVVLARVRSQLAVKKSVDEIRRLEQSLEKSNDELRAVNGELNKVIDRMKSDLDAAARIQQAFLPHELPEVDRARVAWSFEPCSQLAGDMLNAVPLDENHVGIYVLDVSGHGVQAALLSVMLCRYLSNAPDPSSVLRQRIEGSDRYLLVPPNEVANQLSLRFPWHPTEQFFTLVYGILDMRNGEFRFVNAGHPAPIVVRESGLEFLDDGGGIPIGLGGWEYDEQITRISPGDRLYLYSDGLYETMNDGMELYDMERLQTAVRSLHEQPLTACVGNILAEVTAFRGDAPTRDDVSLLAVELTG